VRGVNTAGRVSLAVLTTVLGISPAALAQSAPRVEVGIGVQWIGQQPMGTRAATETTSSGSTTALFSTSSELAGAAGVDARAGVRLTSSLDAEADASYVKPQLRIAISGDTEGAAAVTAAETLQQFTIGGGVRWRVPGRDWSPRFVPFATAGGGYLRQLHEGATLAETGRYYAFGGGVSTLLVTARPFHTKGVGARLDVRAIVRSKGVAFDAGSTTSPSAGVSAFVRF
jgi:hypothetical protein